MADNFFVSKEFSSKTITVTKNTVFKPYPIDILFGTKSMQLWLKVKYNMIKAKYL